MTDEPVAPPPGAALPLGAAPPLRRRRFLRRLFVYSLLLIVPSLVFITYRHFDRNLKSELERTLSNEFGRAVTVANPRLMLPIRVAELTVAGDGEVDSEPVMLLKGISIWPTVSSLFGSDRLISSVSVESAVISVVYDSVTNRWSTAGLFPHPPPDVPKSKTIQFEQLTAFVRSGSHVIEESMRASLTLERKGDYSFIFRMPRASGSVVRTGALDERIAYQVNFEFDTLTQLGLIQESLRQVRLRARYEKDSSDLEINFAADLHKRPVSLDARCRFDTPLISVTGNWTFDTGSGSIEGSFNRLTRQVRVAADGNVDFDARLFHDSLTRGVVAWKAAELTGEFGSPLMAAATIEARNVDFTGGVGVTGLSGELKIAGAIAPGSRVKPHRLASVNGELEFDAVHSPKFTTGKGRFTVSGAADLIDLEGQLDAFGGKLVTKDARFRLSGGKSMLDHGSIQLKDVDLRTLAQSFNMNLPVEIFRAADRWQANGSVTLEKPPAQGGSPHDTVVFHGTLVAPEFAFSATSESYARLAAHTASITLTIGAPVTADFAPAGPVYIDEAALSIDDRRTLIRTSRLSMTMPPPVTPLVVERLDAGHLKEFFATMRADLAPAEKLDLRGSFHGIAQITPETGDRTSYFVELAGALTLRGTPLKVQVIGSIAPQQPYLIFHVHAVDPQALYLSLADMSRVSPDIVKMTGQCTATLTAAGESWEDLNLEGLFAIRQGSIQFIHDPVSVSGISGEIPFRLRRGEKWSLVEMSPKDSRNIYIKRTAYGDLALGDLYATTRFNLRTLHIDGGSFDFAGGTGAGAFAIDFPDTAQPRIAFFGRASNFDVKVFYTMIPFKGALGGRGRGEVELMTGEGWDLELVKLNASLHIDSGIIGSELLKVFVQDMRTEGTVGEITKTALLEMSEWNFKEADLKVRLDQSYYAPDMAIRKFGELVRSEILGDYTIVGNIRPLANYKIWERISPFEGIKVEEKIVVEAAPMRLLMHRVGRLSG